MIVDISEYLMNVFEKKESFYDDVHTMIEHHIENCDPYRRMLANRFSDIPFITANAFKNSELFSIPREKITSQYTSSGTSGKKTTIMLDSLTKERQMKALVAILKNVVTPKRLPMIVLNNRSNTAADASAAASIGFSLVSTKKANAYCSDGSIDLTLLENMQTNRCLLFAFTFELYEFCSQLKLQKRSFDYSNSIILHGGGWKKMEGIVTKGEFTSLVHETLGNASIKNYYGMVEQLGLIFVECEYGEMHMPNFSDVIVRSRSDLSRLDDGKVGLLNIVNLVPTSYPGTSILTRDVGYVEEVNCKCGRKTKSVKVLGRERGSEIRGCSDTK